MWLYASFTFAATSGANGSHDPSRMIESDGKVYIYSTGGGAKSSTDGLVWKDEPAPTWNRGLLPNNQGIWAPDGLFLNGKYLLYGAMWASDKSSALVLLTSPTLDPTSARYAWTDRGVAVAGPVGVTHSCIDPAPVLDEHGDLWVVWGGGYPFSTTADSIFVTRMDNDTGLPLTSDPGYKPPASPGYAIEQGHKEGPYLHYHSGYYYLFYQTGSCCTGTSSSYTIHVARSQTINGGYSGDRVFYASTGNVHGPGHIGIYSACGYDRFTYHYYPSANSVIGENELEWGNDGWPKVGAESTTPMKLCGSNSSSGGAGGNGNSAGAGGSTAGGDGAGGSGNPSAGAGGNGPSGASGATESGGSNSAAGAANGAGANPSGGAAGYGGLAQSGAGSSAVAGTTADRGAETASGCSCRSGRTRGTPTPWLGALPLFLWLRRRRPWAKRRKS